MKKPLFSARRKMELRIYLESRRLSIKEFAKMIGVHANTLSNYLAYRRLPTLEIGRAIEKATKGKVTIDDLLACWEEKKKYA
jgi:transcriptional regulator with XRE-family HTH domain